MVSIRLDGLGARYGKALSLQDISTPTFRAGEVVAVIGPNAAGKSTLFKRICGLIDGPGQVWVDGLAPGAGGICYMPQDIAASAALSVYESVLLACKQGGGWRVSEAELRQIDQTLAALGIASLSFRHVGELSGGQRQLVSLAQVLVRNPEIVLMDEPTSALDLSRQVEVLGHMKKLAREKGVLVLVTLHDLNHVMRFCDQVLVIAGGRQVACGPTAEIVTPALLRETYHVEARVESCSRGFGQVIVDDIAVQGRTFAPAIG
ncbi:MAG: ABC transporter ATP-binding protein [Rhodocyclaceae bacterium]